MLIAFPILIPLITAVLCFVLRNGEAHKIVSFTGAVAHLGVGLVLFADVLAGGPVAAQMGGWAAPFGITLVADLLSAALIVIVGLSAVAVVWYSLREIGPEPERLGWHALAHALIAGVSGAFITGDIFNLYVWYEVMLIASFGLLVIGGGRAQIDGAMKYVALNLVGTLGFLTGVGLLYGATGTLNMADLAGIVPERQDETAILGAGALILFGFASKSALFPVFFWLPASYHTPSFGTSALFSALLTKVGVYSLLRVFTLVYDASDPAIAGALAVGAAATIVLGALGAVAQREMRRVFSYHIISQIGVMVLGLAISTPLALAAAVFYFFHHIPAMMNMFLLGGVVRGACGSERFDRLGGLWTASPVLGIVFLIPTLSLIGIPPLSGFWAKFLVIRAGMEAEEFVLAGIVVAASMMTYFYLGRIFVEAFWKPAPAEGGAPLELAYPVVVPILLLAGVTLVISFGAGSFFALAEMAAGQLIDPSAYRAAVLGGS